MANEEEKLQDLANSIMRQYRSISSETDIAMRLWYRCHTKASQKWYAKWYLANHYVPEEKKVVMLAFIMEIPVEQGISTETMETHQDPQWFSPHLQFRIKTNEPQD